MNVGRYSYGVRHTQRQRKSLHRAWAMAASTKSRPRRTSSTPRWTSPCFHDTNAALNSIAVEARCSLACLLCMVGQNLDRDVQRNECRFCLLDGLVDKPYLGKLTRALGILNNFETHRKRPHVGIGRGTMLPCRTGCGRNEYDLTQAATTNKKLLRPRVFCLIVKPPCVLDYVGKICLA